MVIQCFLNMYHVLTWYPLKYDHTILLPWYSLKYHEIPLKYDIKYQILYYLWYYILYHIKKALIYISEIVWYWILYNTPYHILYISYQQPFDIIARIMNNIICHIKYHIMHKASKRHVMLFHIWYHKSYIIIFYITYHIILCVIPFMI